MFENELESNIKNMMLDSATDSILLYDFDGNFLYFNESAYKTRGYNKEEFMNMKLHELIIHEHVDLIKPRLEDLRIQGSKLYENAHNCKDGSVMQVEVNARVIDFEGNKLILSIIRDITDFKEANESINRLVSIVESSENAIVSTDLEGNITSWNNGAQRIFEYSKDEVIGKNVFDLFFSFHETDEFHLLMEEMKQGRLNRKFESEICKSDGSRVHLSIKLFPLKKPDGELIGSSTIACDITQKIISKEKLKEKEEIYSIISENTGDVIWVLDPVSEKFTYVSPSVYKLRGYTPEEVLCQSMEEVMTPESYQFIKENMPIILQRIRSGDESFKIRTNRVDQLCKDGSIVPTEVVTSYIFNDEGDLSQIVGVSRDITQRVYAEKRLERSLEEKEILLKETHHRVKNNLMVISSLLSLQSQYINDETYQEIFKESQNRARTMALIHERFYQSDDLKSMDFGQYIEKLAKGLIRTYSALGSVNLKLDVKDAMLDINTTVPLGLILNELISNALKYAFPEGNGEIEIIFRKINDEFELIVRDDGVGFPADIDYTKSDTFGMQIVNTLVRQIDGEIELDCRGGTSFRITFTESEIS